MAKSQDQKGFIFRFPAQTFGQMCHTQIEAHTHHLSVYPSNPLAFLPFSDQFNTFRNWTFIDIQTRYEENNRQVWEQ